jgi:hypothetical protein
LVIKLGIAGISEGNGHPFSFSAIINGYNDFNFSEVGWPVILQYLRNAKDGQSGIHGAQVTHAWTQDSEITAKLCAASNIQNQCMNLIDMIGEIDALIIARDDWENHYFMAKPFLERGIPVFIDKPLTLDEKEIQFFLPYLVSGNLMTCSGFRYAIELRDKSRILSEVGKLKLINGVVVNDLNKYGIHLLQAVVGLFSLSPTTIILSRNHSEHESYTFGFEDGLIFNLDCLGNFKKVFHLSLFGENGDFHIDLSDNFSAFKKTLEKFLEMVKTKKPPFDPQETIMLMRTLQYAQNLAKGESIKLDFSKSNTLMGENDLGK